MLPREVESDALCTPSVIGEDDQIVTLGGSGEVTPHDLRNEETLGLRDRQLFTKNSLDSLLKGTVIFTFVGSESPLIAKECREVQKLRNFVDRHTLGYT